MNLGPPPVESLKTRIANLAKVVHVVPSCPSCDSDLFIFASPTTSGVARCNECDHDYSIDEVMKLQRGMAVLVDMVMAVVNAIPTGIDTSK